MNNNLKGQYHDIFLLILFHDSNPFGPLFIYDTLKYFRIWFQLAEISECAKKLRCLKLGIVIDTEESGLTE